ncbi:MAG: S8 family serine peptidase [Candidatus Accumulibacter sp.]|uniref:S8 family serine peptidase n=1 Tax=Accumulibacter sp. TaxID=2053492 RepID=UPI001A37CCC2|nr:S8 family serine peptidase [Accumulibacter sp.]MBL8393564.1 S8 family serine peptidase [Accumulibacter sp.]
MLTTKAFPLRSFHSAALLLGIVAIPAFAAPPAAPQAVYVPGRLLIQQRAGLSDAEVDLALQPHGGKRVGKIGPINVHVVQLPPQANTEAAAAALARNKHFKFVERDRILPLSGTTNDPSLSSQWHLAKINAPTAWDTTSGSNIIIAILDTGVDGSHPDLAAQMVPGWNTYDNNSLTADVYGHGTAVAGTAAAAGNNGVGIASVAYRARIMPVRISDTAGYGYSSTIASGLTWAADNGARVANISYAIAGSAAVDSAAQYLIGKGGLTAVSAGNDGVGLTIAPTANLVVVSATDSSDAITSWSNYGSHINIAAPGSNILTTSRGGNYGFWSGTSFSSPVVAGTIALMMAANPTLPISQVQSLLYASSTDLGSAGKDVHYGAGRVNAAAATQAAAGTTASDTQAPTVTISAPRGGTVSGLVALDVAASDNVGVARVDLVIRGAAYASDASAPYGFTWDTTRMPDGEATVIAYAYDAANNYASSAAVSFTIANAPATPDTTPPSVTIKSPLDGAKVSNVVNISGLATDNLGTGGMTLSLSIDGKVVSTVTGGSLSTNWNTKKVAAGTHTLKLTAKDAAGNLASQSISVTK